MWVAAGILLALVIISVPAFVVAQYLLMPKREPQVAEPAPAPKPVAAKPKPLPAVTTAERQRWIEEVAAATAREVDELYRRVHMATAMMDRAEEGMKLIETLAQSGKFPEPSADDSTTQAESQPYQSQYESLYKQCTAHLNASLPKEDFDRATVQQTADAWAAAKQTPLEKQLEDQLNQQPFLR